MLEKISTILVGYLDIIPIMLSFCILVALNLFVSGIIAKIVRFFLSKTIDIVLISFIYRATKFFSFIVGILLIMGAVGMSLSSITAMMGISTIAIGMSLKEV